MGETCEVCGKTVMCTWPVAVAGNVDDIRNLCDGCAAMDPPAAAVIEMIERSRARD